MLNRINNTIKNILKGEFFDEDDFELVEDSFKVTIKYKYDEENYFLQFNKPTKKEAVDVSSVVKQTRYAYKFIGNFKPGKYSDNEQFEYYNFDNVKSEIKNWTIYLYEELVGKSVRNKNNTDSDYEQYKIKVDDIEKKLDKMNDKEVFSKEEQENIIGKLNEIEAKYQEQLKEIIEDQEQLKNEIVILQQDFIKLKRSLTYMSKKNWGKKLLSKTTELFRDKNKRKIVYMIGKGVDILLKNHNINFPVLGEAIDIIDKVKENGH